MKNDEEFRRRIEALYEVQRPEAGDLRSEELSTMLDVFLGETYKKASKDEIAKIQEDLHKKQESLADKFRAGTLNNEEYLTSLNSLFGRAFAECKRVLGSKDFKKLFGVAYAAEKDFVDRSAFLEVAPRENTLHIEPSPSHRVMSKVQLARLIAEQSGTSKKVAAAFLEHLADTAIKETRKTGVFVIPGIGRLVRAGRKARIGRNPQTGEPIQVKAKTVVKFRVAKAAKDAIAPKK